MDIHEFYDSSFQNGMTLSFTKQLQHVRNQKGAVTYEVVVDWQA